MVLLGGLGSFSAALAKSSPSGITIVEDAIDNAIRQIEDQIKVLDPETFESDAFIPAAAFGAADRSSEVAVHHTRAHRVIKATLDGVLKDLNQFKTACVEARTLFRTADSDAATEMQLRLAAVQALSTGVSNEADAAYDQAVYDNASVDPEASAPGSNEAPATDEGSTP